MMKMLESAVRNIACRSFNNGRESIYGRDTRKDALVAIIIATLYYLKLLTSLQLTSANDRARRARGGLLDRGSRSGIRRLMEQPISHVAKLACLIWDAI